MLFRKLVAATNDVVLLTARYQAHWYLAHSIAQLFCFHTLVLFCSQIKSKSYLLKNSYIHNLCTHIRLQVKN